MLEEKIQTEPHIQQRVGCIIQTVRLFDGGKKFTQQPIKLFRCNESDSSLVSVIRVASQPKLKCLHRAGGVFP